MVLFPPHPEGWSFHKTVYMNLGKRGLSLKEDKFNIVEFHIPLYFEATKKSSLCASPQNGPNSNGATILKLSFLYIASTNIQILK